MGKDERRLPAGKAEKKDQENRVLVRFIKFLDMLAITAVFAVIWMHFYSDMVYLQPFYERGNRC